MLSPFLRCPLQSSTQFYPFDLPCISACETTQRQYWHLQRLHVERLLTTISTTTTTNSLQPQLLHDNETLNTLTLKWPITTATTSLLPALHLASRPFNIQYQYVLKAMPSASSSPSSSSVTPSALTVNDTPDISGKEGRQNKQHSKQQDNLEQQQDDVSDNVGVDGKDFDEYSNDDADDDDNVEDGRKRKLQKQKEEEQWWNLADYNCNENFECDIMDGLMPYTSYKVRSFLDIVCYLRG